MVTACIIKLDAMLFRQEWIELIGPIQGRNKNVCRENTCRVTCTTQDTNKMLAV